MTDKVKQYFRKKRKLILRFVSLFLVLSLVFWSYTAFENFSLDIDFYNISDEKIPESFNGYRIAQISDFHNRKSKIVTDKIIQSLKSEKPDVIFLTGDFVDGNDTIVEISMAFMERIINIAPVYYVLGNHECNFANFYKIEFNEMINKFESMGVTILRQASVKVFSDENESINLYGIDDPYFHCKDPSLIRKATKGLCQSLTIDEGYNILLAHHPEQLAIYEQFGFDLVLSGHAHGGQITFFGLPIVVPDQEPPHEFTEGIYNSGDTTLVLSRGIGYSTINIRFFSPPNLVYVDLKSL